MKRLIRELRLAIFVGILRIAVFFLPKEATKTIQWILQMPLED